MSRKKEDNLVSLATRTQQERKNIASKGAEATNKLKRKRKAFKELFISILSTPIPQEELKEKIKSLGLKNEEENYNTLLGITTLQEALKGNMKAIEIIRDTIWEKPKEEVAIEVNNNISKEIEDYINERR